MSYNYPISEPPRTLSQKLAKGRLCELDVVECAAIIQNKEKLILARRDCYFHWGDDGYYPTISEHVAIYSTEEDFRLANRLRAIPDGVYSCYQQAIFVPVSIAVEPTNQIVDSTIAHIVFEAHDTYYDDALDEYCKIPTYRHDGTGVPIQVLQSEDDAKDLANRLTHRKLSKTRSHETGLPSLCSYGEKLEDFTSLSHVELIEATQRLGVDCQQRVIRPYGHPLIAILNQYIFISRKNPEAYNAERARRILGLLDRLVLYKVVSMEVTHFLSSE